VHERAWVCVIDGEVEINEPGGEPVTGGPGLLSIFDPNERHEVKASTDARLLLVLSPWPGKGHPSAS
jgi:quercetin dioxygenase-like cupin family protein